MALTKLKLIRLQRGLLQWDVARKAGLPESLLSRIENGRVTPSVDVVEALARALEVRPEDLSGVAALIPTGMPSSSRGCRRASEMSPHSEAAE